MSTHTLINNVPFPCLVPLFTLCVSLIQFRSSRLDWDGRHLIVGFFQRREIPWEKVPFVPRPSLVPDPITAFGKRKPDKREVKEERKLICSPSERAKIKPKELVAPPKPYVSAREATRERVFSAIKKESIGLNDSMDVVLPRLHKVAELPDLPYKRRIVQSSEFY